MIRADTHPNGAPGLIKYERWHIGLHAVLEVGVFSNIRIIAKDMLTWIAVLRGDKDRSRLDLTNLSNLKAGVLVNNEYIIPRDVALKIADDLENMWNDEERQRWAKESYEHQKELYYGTNQWQYVKDMYGDMYE